MTTQQFDARTARAQEILEQGLISPVHPGRGWYKVQSQSNHTTYYNVDLTDGTCPCPDHARGNFCKHLQAARLADKIIKQHGELKREEWYEEIDA